MYYTNDPDTVKISWDVEEHAHYDHGLDPFDLEDPYETGVEGFTTITLTMPRHMLVNSTTTKVRWFNGNRQDQETEKEIRLVGLTSVLVGLYGHLYGEKILGDLVYSIEGTTVLSRTQIRKLRQKIDLIVKDRARSGLIADD